MYSINFDVPDEWIEPIYDHVHHGRYFLALERARLGLLEHIGFPNDALLAQGKALVITRVDVAYKREVKRGAITVTCEEPTIEGRTIVVRQRILNERGKTAAEGMIESVFMDMSSRRGMDIPEDFRAAFLRFGTTT